MHELSIALNIVDVAVEEAERQGDVRVRAVHIRLGPLSGVVKEALVSAYGLAREGARLDAADLVVEEVPLVAYCPRCAVMRTPDIAQHLACPECETPLGEVVSGRELDVVAIEVDT